MKKISMILLCAGSILSACSTAQEGQGTTTDSTEMNGTTIDSTMMDTTMQDTIITDTASRDSM